MRSYRYGFQGQEKDDEVSGDGNSYTAEFWQYSPRIGKRWNIDPIVKVHESSYATFANNPIMFSDANGADTSNVTTTLKSTKSTSSFNDLSRISPTFNDFFNSFTVGDNKNIMMRFTDQGLADDEKGRAELMYKGVWVGDPSSSIPADAKLGDFEILVSINPKLYYSGKEENNADRAQTLIHELLLHAYTAVNFLNTYTNKTDNTVNGISLVKEHNDYYDKDGDHNALSSLPTEANYTMPFKITYRDIIGHYKNVLPVRKTEKIEVNPWTNAKHLVPYWKIMLDAFESETINDPKKGAKPYKL